MTDIHNIEHILDDNEARTLGLFIEKTFGITHAIRVSVEFSDKYDNWVANITSRECCGRMALLEKAKLIIHEHYDEADCGIFNCENHKGDPIGTLYKDDELTIEICWAYKYFEVFGLTNEEFEELEKYYNLLGEQDDVSEVDE